MTIGLFFLNPSDLKNDTRHIGIKTRLDSVRWIGAHGWILHPTQRKEEQNYSFTILGNLCIHLVLICE